MSSTFVMDDAHALMDSRLREFIEPAMGDKLDRVRVYIGDGITESLNAVAVTIGNEIHLATAGLSLNRKLGKLILAHELVHVVQQSFGTKSFELGNDRSPDFRSLVAKCEEEAYRLAEEVLKGTRARVRHHFPVAPQTFDTEFILKRIISADNADNIHTGPLKTKFWEPSAIKAISDELQKHQLPTLRADGIFNSTHQTLLHAGHEKISAKALQELSKASPKMKKKWDAVQTGGVQSTLPPPDLFEGYFFLGTCKPNSLQYLLHLGNRGVDIPPTFDVQNDPKIADRQRLVVVNAGTKKLHPPEVGDAMTLYLEMGSDPSHQADHFMLTPGAEGGSFQKARDWIDGEYEKGKSALHGTNDLGSAVIYFGRALHCIQDSFSEAHTERRESGGKSCVVRLKSYPEEHLKKSDEVDDGVGDKADLAMKASKEYLKIVSSLLFKSKVDQTKSWNTFKDKWLSRCGGTLSAIVHKGSDSQA